MPDKEFGVFGRLSLKVSLALLLAVAGVTAILLHIFLPGARECLAFSAAVVGGVAIVYTGYYAAAALRLNVEGKKKQLSFQALGVLSTIDMVTVRMLIEKEISQKNISPQDLYQKIVGEPHLLKAIMALLGLLEDISIGIQNDVLDEGVLYYSLSFIVPWYFNNLKHYIDEERNRCDEHLFIELEKLADVWKVEKSLMTGKVFEY